MEMPPGCGTDKVRDRLWIETHDRAVVSTSTHSGAQPGEIASVVLLPGGSACRQMDRRAFQTEASSANAPLSSETWHW
jgi:hypothetical protein